MSSLDQAVARIDKVLDSDFDPQTAYPLRARLGRAVLASSRAASALPITTDTGWEKLLARLNAATQHVMQPSEPFDTHWQDQWRDVLSDLRQVRRIITDNRSN